MKVRILCVKGYNYPDKKTGEIKEGITMDVCVPDQLNESDGRGNFTIGSPCENIYIPKTLPMEVSELTGLIGKDVELVYERRLGQKFERLTAIQPL